MLTTDHNKRARHTLLALALAATMLGNPGPAQAQGLFDFLFGRRSAPPAVQPYADPNTSGPGFATPEEGGAPRTGGPAVAHCVRLCDGRHFPINYRSGAGAADICRSFCPAAQTKVFSGSGIDHAVASDGRRYADLPNAFVYRDKLVPDCTCNGRTPTGLSFVDPKADPTLRAGDIVATNQGMMAFAGGGRQGMAEFTPVDRAAVSAEMRRRLSDLKIAPRNADGEAPANTEAAPKPAPANPRPQRSQASR